MRRMLDRCWGPFHGASSMAGWSWESYITLIAYRALLFMFLFIVPAAKMQNKWEPCFPDEGKGGHCIESGGSNYERGINIDDEWLNCLK